MELYVMILDDEEIILDGLSHFPWEDYGCTVVATAMDGEKGLELLGECKPDIILSDIKMPGMDGLELAKKAKELQPEVEIILLTGYDDFGFAKKAIHLGIREYLLKPVNFREMHTAVGAVCTQIRNKRKAQKAYTELRNRYRETIPAVRRKVVSDLIYGRYNDNNEMQKRMENLSIFIDKYVFVYGNVCLPIEEEKKGLEPNLFDFIVCNVCEENLKQIGQQVYSESDNLGYSFIITFSNDTDDRTCENDCAQACEQIQKNIREVLHVEISFGISQVEDNPLNMNQAYNKAMQACEQGAYLGEGSGILTYADVAEVELPIWKISDGKKQWLLSELLQGNIQAARKFVDDIFEECPDIEEMRYNAMDLVLLSAQHLRKDRSNRETGRYITEKLKHIYEGNTRQEILRNLKRTLTSLAEKNKDESISRNEQTAKQMSMYIAENYSQDLSLDTLADHFKLSKTYINRLLKSYCKKSFLEILLECRMVRAEELIVEGKHKVYEIAEMVGYHDHSYFIRVFKKQYGVTPNSYKRI